MPLTEYAAIKQSTRPELSLLAIKAAIPPSNEEPQVSNDLSAGTLASSKAFRQNYLRSFPSYTKDITPIFLHPRVNHPDHFILHKYSGFQNLHLHSDPSHNLLCFLYLTSFSENENGFVHGGAIAAIFDAIAGFVGWNKVEKKYRVWTRVHETRFLKPTRSERDYVVEAKVTKVVEGEEKIKVVVECRLISSDEERSIQAESSTLCIAMKDGGKVPPRTPRTKL